MFLYAVLKDVQREWKDYQKEYKRLEISKIKEKMNRGESKDILKDLLRSVRRRPLEIKQILATDLKRVDRCLTCHVGYDGLTNASLINGFTEHPFAAPKNKIHDKHPFDKYGCAICHEGQGLATTFVGAGHMPKDEAQKSEWKKKHKWHVVEFWEQPMKAGPLIYASCNKCHESHPDVEGMEIVKKGQQIFRESGCIGCHQVRGEGGTIAPDLAEETSVKPLTRIDFGHAVTSGLITKEERTLENWIRLHFTTAPTALTPGDPEGHLSPDSKNPQPVAPTGMPYFGFTREESESLVAYVTSLKKEMIPYTYRIPAAKTPEPQFASSTAHGRYVFQKYGCGGCHGKNADSGIPVFNKQGGRAPDLVKTVGTFTRAELVKKIQEGVNPEEKEDIRGPTPPIYMPSFKDRIIGSEMENLVTYLQSIAVKDEVW
ncbi:MAG: c-type cytochrome [Elusimicrobia bacterium]|nr:c-type cytochrome [Elusimicrobiota bacterium]